PSVRREARPPRSEFSRPSSNARNHRAAMFEPLLVVSTVTDADAPNRIGGSSGCKLSETRTGNRCVTFTQFPLASCGGRREKAELLAGLIASTVPANWCD